MRRSGIVFMAFNILWLPLAFFLPGYVQSTQSPTDYQCTRPEPNVEPWPEMEDPGLVPDDRCGCSRDG